MVYGTEEDKFEFSVAPMIRVSTPEYRRFMRIVSPSSLVFTEMIVDNSLIYMSTEALEKKIGVPSNRCVIQIGGSNPESISMAVKRAQKLGYTKYNLNCGCPSDRVQNGCFGAILMKTPKRIAEIVQRVYEDTGVVMSVKCRTGVDEVEDYASFKKMIEIIVNESPCRKFYIHARKCLLKGLSPADNRKIPPLVYEYVFQLKKEMPFLKIVLNGGIREIEKMRPLIPHVDGLMLGRKPMDDPMFFSQIEQVIFNRNVPPLHDVVSKYLQEAANKREERDAFYLLDRANTIPNTPTGDIPENTISDLLCRYSDLKPIEPVMFGKKGCKKYKQAISDISRERIQIPQVFDRISHFFVEDILTSSTNNIISEENKQ
ncbi:tRNA-dihydrouridine synthase A [Nematocida sp. LUAm3]|nr:tRNA-dihydrouridine synthase A [Nematocida sp. LUAm3]KAI5175576.1 tRNA-dihydrouridine synthase A [Nematocida sp. LUAm2]KAI5178394.1 tRNA-dihydrouridine synthase A [Nematocida sp. LUAm1]